MGQSLHKIKYNLNGKMVTVQTFANDDGRIDGYCFSEGVYIPDPYGEPKTTKDIPPPKEKTQDEINAELAEISSYQFLALERKKLSAEALETYGVRVSVSETDGVSPEVVYYPYTRNGKVVAYKCKLLPKNGEKKKLWSMGDMKDIDFFGWEKAKGSGSKKVIITEGEDDAIAMARIIERYTKAEYKDSMPAVISLPHGAGNAKRDVGRVKQKLKEHFKEFVLAFDQDEAGTKAAEEVMKVFPEAVVATLPSKDANQCLLDGKTRAAFNAVTFNAEKPKNTRLVFGEQLHEEAREPPKFGDLTWPWGHINDKTRGIRYGETIYIGAGVKMG